VKHSVAAFNDAVQSLMPDLLVEFAGSLHGDLQQDDADQEAIATAKRDGSTQTLLVQASSFLFQMLTSCLTVLSFTYGLEQPAACRHIVR
jgi:hypothetical protein